MDDIKYELYQKEQLKKFEDICQRCGECCGSRDGDPCVNLAKNAATGKYYCKVYENRLGPQKTMSGKVFNCIRINDVMRMSHLRPNCAYNRVRFPLIASYAGIGTLAKKEF